MHTNQFQFCDAMDTFSLPVIATIAPRYRSLLPVSACVMWCKKDICCTVVSSSSVSNL